MTEELRDLKGVAAELERELEETTLGEFEDDETESNGTEHDTGEGEAITGSEPATTPATNGSGGRDSSLTEFASSARPGGETPEAGESESEVGTSGETDASDTTGGADTVGATGAGDGDDVDDSDDPDGTVVTAGAADDSDVVEIVVDQRELDSTIARELSTREGVRTRLETLAVGDYVLSDRVVVERKTVSDFLDTLLGSDRSLFAQARDASRHYARPVVVIEGDGLYEERNVHPGAIRGAIASLAVDFGVSVLHTRDEADTTELLSTIATREQTERDRAVSVHGEKAAKTLDEQQEYVVGAIADVGPVTAQSLLSHLGSVEAVMTASEEELQEVRGVGAKTAARIREVVGSDYAFEERDDAAPGDDTDGADGADTEPTDDGGE
jgi:Fanconi anemia group M protein